MKYVDTIFDESFYEAYDDEELTICTQINEEAFRSSEERARYWSEDIQRRIGEVMAPRVKQYVGVHPRLMLNISLVYCKPRAHWRFIIEVVDDPSYSIVSIVLDDENLMCAEGEM